MNKIVLTGAAGRLGAYLREPLSKLSESAEAPAADTGDLAQTHHGGPFASTELGSSGLATMKIINDAKTT